MNWTLAIRHGSHSEPVEKSGLAALTAEMLSHGAANLSFQQLSDELENHAITLGVSDGGDVTKLVRFLPHR